MTELSSVAEKIFEMKYQLGDEDWDGLAWRVASYVGKVEKDEYGKTTEESIEIIKDFYDIIRKRLFIPGGRILKNSDTGVKNLFNCFFFNIGDSREEIYQALKDSAEIFAWGGGLGIRVSDLREEGALIRSTGTYSSGPLSFMELFNTTGDVIQQASRRAAEIALMDISHPDIEQFLRFKSTLNRKNKNLINEFKRDLKSLERKEYNVDVLEKTLIDSQMNHFNISVEISDKFMEAVENDELWDLISPATKKVIKTIRARELLMEMAYQIWESGDPGIFFSDRVKKDNMVKYVSETMGCNPCAEINLLSYEPCCLGSINLSLIFDNGGLNLELLEYIVRNAVRFLDDVVTLSSNNVPKVNEMARNLRRIGIGVFGFADLLVKVGIPYNSKDALLLGNYLSWFISFFSWLESINLAGERGPFPLYDPEQVDLDVVEKVLTSRYVSQSASMDEVRKIGVRNVSVTALAPTGSIALVGEANSVIEPYFALAYKRHITLGEANIAKDTIIELNPILFEQLKGKVTEEAIDKIKEEVIRKGTVQDIDIVPSSIKEVFVTAHDITPQDHINMQAVWQEYISNAVSKTINLPSSSTPKDIYDALIAMWKAGLKSSTLYRNGSKSFQILNTGN
jgi:ribonucleoside-diphosphate reductase alpha chain